MFDITIHMQYAENTVELGSASGTHWVELSQKGTGSSVTIFCETAEAALMLRDGFVKAGAVEVTE